ncbi:MAG: zinc ribbon domain-containing protein [Oscillospiraceae bacterium]|jgi:hypothetical protein|nr:zinc ribbon domain-containing protein [Oscillospiraceae bacterium]
MFCNKCGNQIPDLSVSCPHCGTVQQLNPAGGAPATAAQSANQYIALADIPFKTSGKSARFFSDHIEFKGQSLRYDQIAQITARAAVTVHTYVGIPVGRSFDGVVLFKMDSGKTHKIIMSAMNVFGIGKARKNEKLYPPLFEAVNAIVAKNVAQRYINQIRAGATVEVAGLTINSLQATAQAKISKKITVINKENYRESQITNGYGGVAVYDKPGELLWSSSVFSNKNILLVPYILDAIFA